MFFFKEKTAYEMRISDWSSDVCSSDLLQLAAVALKLELVAKKAAEAVNDDQIIRVVGIRRRLDHRPEDRAAGVGRRRARLAVDLDEVDSTRRAMPFDRGDQIGSASCRERVCQYV